MKLFTIILFLTTIALAKKLSKKKHEQRHYHAHEHGAGALGIAFEGLKGHVEFKISSGSIFGFEYAAKSENDKKQRNEALARLEIKISEMLQFEAALNCKIIKDKIEVVAESSGHSDVVAAYTVTCDKSPMGSLLIFNFQQQFPKIKDLDVQVIVDNFQKSIEVKSSKTKLVLK